MESELLRLEIDQVRRDIDDGRLDRKEIRSKIHMLSASSIKTDTEIGHLKDSVDKLYGAIDRLSGVVQKLDDKLTTGQDKLSQALAKSSSSSMRWSLAVAGPLLTAAIVILGVIR